MAGAARELRMPLFTRFDSAMSLICSADDTGVDVGHTHAHRKPVHGRTMISHDDSAVSPNRIFSSSIVRTSLHSTDTGS
jgi:hypothetical protein